MGKLKVIEVEVKDVQKRRAPSKHYVYIIYVTWSDNTTTVVYRRYSLLFDFQNKLLDKFPNEAGSEDPVQRIIPILPGKIFFGRSHIRDVALKRLHPINDYCKTLIRLPPHISECDDVIEFFESTSDDLDPPKQDEKANRTKSADKISKPKVLEQYVMIDDYVKQAKRELTLSEGDVVEVMEKTETGWWFVNAEDEQGWVPSSFLERADGTAESTTQRSKPGQEEKYMCIDTFTSENDDELSLEKGAVVEVIEKNLEGWWMIRYRGQEGWAPATYLEKVVDQNAQNLPTMHAVEVVKSLKDVSNLLQKSDDPKPDINRNSQSVPTYTQIKKAPPATVQKPPPRKDASLKRTATLPKIPIPAKEYVTISAFKDTVGDGISFVAGQTVEVKNKTNSGWWLVQIGNEEGWAPSSYISQKGPEPGAVRKSDDMDTDAKPKSAANELSGALEAKFGGRQDRPISPPQVSTKKPSVPVKDSVKPVLPTKGPAGTAPKTSSNRPAFSPPSVPSDRPSVKPPGVPSNKPGVPSKVAGSTSPRNNSDDELEPQKKMGNIADALRANFEKKESSNRPPVGTDKPKPPGKWAKSQAARPSLPAFKKNNQSVPSNAPLERSGPDIDKPAGTSMSSLKSRFESETKESSPPGIKPAPPRKLVKPAIHTSTPAKPFNTPPKEISTSGKVSGLAASLQGKLASREPGTGSNRPALPAAKPGVQAKPTPVVKSSTKVDELPKANVSQLANALKGQLNFGGAPQMSPAAPPQQVSEGSYRTCADFQGTNEGELSFVTGEIVEVLEESDSGWWMVKINGLEGWAPSTYIEDSANVDSSRAKPSVQASSVGTNTYTVMSAFEADQESELSIQEGDQVEVLEKPEGGWWMAKLGSREGWVPSDYLTPD